jgi:Domain of unknown function (DUF4265)
LGQNSFDFPRRNPASLNLIVRRHVAALRPECKGLFRVAEDNGSANVETLWAYDLGNDRYRLDNSPFYAYSVSVGDVVLAPVDPNEGRPRYQRVLKKSGNRTVRVILDPPLTNGNYSDEVILELLSLGCSYEGANPGYLCIVIPPESDFALVCERLAARNIQWEHADPDYSELYPDDV